MIRHAQGLSWLLQSTEKKQQKRHSRKKEGTQDGNHQGPSCSGMTSCHATAMQAALRLTSADTLAKASAGAVVGGRAGHVSGGVERRRPASRSVDHVDRRAGVSTSLLRSALEVVLRSVGQSRLVVVLWHGVGLGLLCP